jgi:6-phosphogluconolactonase/glucosamine-6-phosphate isomerase/deaminase
MQIVTSDVPAKMAGEHISNIIAEHDGDVVCLLAGGSALDIVGYITDPQKSECRTIFIMGDERGSRDAKINNSLQLTERYPDHYVTKNIIFTIPELDENLENFTSRISQTFSEEIKNLRKPKFLQVLGVGSDGHTSGIFPLPEFEFSSIYNRDLVDIVPVHLQGLTIDSRASFTPNWILTKSDEVIAYIAGASKKMIIKSLINESEEIHERPAELIKRHTRSTVYTDQLIDSN